MIMKENEMSLEEKISYYVAQAANLGREEGAMEATKKAMEALIPLLSELSKTVYTFKPDGYNQWTIYKNGEEYQSVGAPSQKVAEMVMTAQQNSYVDGCHETILRVMDILKQN